GPGGRSAPRRRHRGRPGPSRRRAGPPAPCPRAGRPALPSRARPPPVPARLSPPPAQPPSGSSGRLQASAPSRTPPASRAARHASWTDLLVDERVALHRILIGGDEGIQSLRRQLRPFIRRAGGLGGLQRLEPLIPRRVGVRLH